MMLAVSQQFLELKSQVETERRDRTPRHKLRDEILQYGKLKNAWGLEHIQIKRINHDCEYCEEKHCVITGHYRDYYELTKQNVYLGRSYRHAHSRMNHVKSFL